jgi:hypothetical protein
MMTMKFWNNPHRLRRESLQQRIHRKWFVQVPGCVGDPTDRGQPERFEKWYKLPRAAHRLFWRTHKKEATRCRC